MTCSPLTGAVLFFNDMSPHRKRLERSFVCFEKQHTSRPEPSNSRVDWSQTRHQHLISTHALFLAGRKAVYMFLEYNDIKLQTGFVYQVSSSPISALRSLLVIPLNTQGTKSAAFLIKIKGLGYTPFRSTIKIKPGIRVQHSNFRSVQEVRKGSRDLATLSYGEEDLY